MQGRNRDADVENGHVDAVGAGEGGANWESTKISFFNVACYLQNHLETRETCIIVILEHSL